MTRSPRRGCPKTLLYAFLILLSPAAGRAEEVVVAVASNFAPVAEGLAEGFAASTDHEVTLVAGSTGMLYAQIVRGAPFDVFLAADSARPARLVADGHAIPDARRVYAVGRLVLWSGARDPGTRVGPELLAAGAFRHLAIANPDLAPYGVAAREVLQSLGLDAALEERLVFGENVGQAFALVASGNAELGFIAQAQVMGFPARREAGWLVPARHHTPIRQEGVLLARAAAKPSARAFLDYLATDEAKRAIEAAGYEVP